MIGSLHHIGIAVSRLSEAVRLWRSMGFMATPPEVVESEGVRLAFVRAGDTRVELLESLTPSGVIARFIEKRGEGLHHVAFRVEEVRVTMAALASRGFHLVDEEPRIGHGGRLVAFVHPKSLHGVLLEVVQDSASR